MDAMEDQTVTMPDPKLTLLERGGLSIAASAMDDHLEHDPYHVNRAAPAQRAMGEAVKSAMVKLTAVQQLRKRATSP